MVKDKLHGLTGQILLETTSKAKNMVLVPINGLKVTSIRVSGRKI